MSEVGTSYRRADEELSIGTFDPMGLDPAVVERGTRGHAATQNALADHLVQLGIQPRSPRPEEPSFDLAWERRDVVFVAEIKSLKEAIEQCDHGQPWRKRKTASPQDIAEGVAFLCSEAGSFLTGCVLPYSFHS